MQAPGGCATWGRTPTDAGRVAGDIAAKFLRPGDRILLVYADHGYAGHKGRADGFLERLAERGLRQEDCRVAETHDNYDETLAAVTAALAEEPDLKYIYMANRSVPACMEGPARGRPDGAGAGSGPRQQPGDADLPAGGTAGLHH